MITHGWAACAFLIGMRFEEVQKALATKKRGKKGKDEGRKEEMHARTRVKRKALCGSKMYRLVTIFPWKNANQDRLLFYHEGSPYGTRSP